MTQWIRTPTARAMRTRCNSTEGYTGLTPGDVYAVPTPQLTQAVTFTTAQSILSPPFNQNTLPLIISGPQILTTQAVGTTGEDSTGSANLISNDSTSQFNVTFDRPVQTSTFTADQVMSITVRKAPSWGRRPSVLLRSISKSTPRLPPALACSIRHSPSIRKTRYRSPTSLSRSASLRRGFRSDCGPGRARWGYNSTVFGCGGRGSQGFVNTVFDDSAQTSITQGKAPLTGTFIPEYRSTSTTLTDLQGLLADGIWHLKLTNITTGAPRNARFLVAEHHAAGRGQSRGFD